MKDPIMNIVAPAPVGPKFGDKAPKPKAERKTKTEEKRDSKREMKR